MSAPKYDHVMLASMRAEGMSWSEIAGRLGLGDAKKLRQTHSKWRQRNVDEPVGEYGGQVLQQWVRENGRTVHVRMPQAAPPDIDHLWDELTDRYERWSPATKAPPPVVMPGHANPNLAVLSLSDVHLGMRGWHAETGQPSQDLDTISDEYLKCSDTLVGVSRVYPIERYLILVGNDLLHADGYEGKAATTRAGTPQDMDTRIEKVFVRAVDLSTHTIDSIRARGLPATVIMVRGNHDPTQVHALGCVLAAWYRDDPGVEILNTPSPRDYWAWHDNVFMIYHGELNRKGVLPYLIFADECPSDLWAYASHREILTGHWHARKTQQTITTLQEERGMILRSLSGLTGTDAWHAMMGYRHARASTLLVYRATGGLVALHEVTP